MIQIIRGVYGHYIKDPETGKTRVVARDSRSEPIDRKSTRLNSSH